MYFNAYTISLDVRSRRRRMKTTPSVPVDRVAAASAAAILLAVGGVSSVNGIFGIYDNTADELSDLLNIDDVPPVIVTAAKIE